MRLPGSALRRSLFLSCVPRIAIDERSGRFPQPPPETAPIITRPEGEYLRCDMNESTSSLSTANRAQPTHEEISHRAQELWENYGRPSGRDEEIWLEAERALQMTPPDAAQAAPATAPLDEAPAATAPSAASVAPRKSRAGSAVPKMPGARGARNAGR